MTAVMKKERKNNVDLSSEQQQALLSLESRETLTLCGPRLPTYCS